MKTKCKICKETFEKEKQLHSHLRKHKIRMAEYYQTHYPRYDKYDKSIIKFKNKNQYLTSDFNDRGNLHKWLDKVSIIEAKEYCTGLLVDRKKEKNLTYAPTEIELRTTMMPPIHYYNKIFKDYYELCEELGFKPKYQTPRGNEYPKELNYDHIKNNDISIYVDTREQKPLKFNLPVQVKTLKFGDYTLSHPGLCINTHVERKSLVDFIGTLSGGYKRFRKEIERAHEASAPLVILVEDTLDHCLAFKKLPYISKKIKATPEFVLHNARELIQDYRHIQLLFVKGKVEAARVTEKLLLCPGPLHHTDLQNAYDTGAL